MILAVFSSLTLGGAAVPPLGVEGGAEFLFEDRGTSLRSIAAFDLSTGAVVLQADTPRGPRVWHRTPDGKRLKKRSGESSFLPADDRDAFRCDILMLTERFPSVAHHALLQIDDADRSVRRLDDGTMEVTTELVAHSLGFAVIDHPEHARLARTAATYVFDADGRLTRFVVGTPDDGGYERVAIDAGGRGDYREWVFLAPGADVVEVTSWDPSDSMLRDSTQTATRLVDVAIHNAQTEREQVTRSLATEEGARSMQRATRRVRPESNVAVSRVALVITGAALALIGIIA